MMMIARNADYEDVLKAVKDRNVAVWTCNTCARLCNGIGGKQAADRLAEKLKEDGINVTASISVSAACLMSKVVAKNGEIPEGTDTILALTCDVGATCAGVVFSKEIMIPFVTLGSGFVNVDGTIVVTLCDNAKVPATLTDVAKEKGMSASPLV